MSWEWPFVFLSFFIYFCLTSSFTGGLGSSVYSLGLLSFSQSRDLADSPRSSGGLAHSYI